MIYSSPTAYEPPTDDDLADPLAFLVWYHRMMGLYQHNRINWTCVRTMNAVVTTAIENFNARTARVAGSIEAYRAALPHAYRDSIEIPAGIAADRFTGVGETVHAAFDDLLSKNAVHIPEADQGN